MVNLFYGSPYDVREIEANILAEDVANCISPAGNLSSEVYMNGVFREDFRDFFLEKCNLTFDSSNPFEDTQYYVEVNFYKSIVLKDPDFTISEGNPNWKPDCELNPKKHKNLVRCVEKQFYVNVKGDIYTVKILSMVGKTEQNVK